MRPTLLHFQRPLGWICPKVNPIDWVSDMATAHPIWKDGQDVIIGAAVTDEEAKTLFPGGWKTIKPYLRVLPQPK